MSRTQLTKVTLAALAATSAEAWAGRSVYSPYAATTFIYDSSADQKVHLLKIDLTDKRVRIRITSPDDALKLNGAKRPMGPHQFALRRHLQMATNGSIGGDPGNDPDMHVLGLIKGYGAMWPLASAGLHIKMDGDVRSCALPDGGSYLCSTDGLMAISADNQDILMHTVTELSFPNNELPSTYDVAAAGRPVIVWDGEVVDHVAPYAAPDNACSPSACAPEPRTAYGLTRDRKTLLFAVVDGREFGGLTSAGMTTRALGKKLKDNGAWWAFNLDGGGSSAMYIKGWQNMAGSTAYPSGIVNRPSDGSVRTVPLQIGIQIVQPRGHLHGYVRHGAPSTGAAISGAAVTVTYVDEDGLTKIKTALTGADGAYSLDQIHAGRPSVAVTAAGYKTRTRTTLIAAGDTNFTDFGLAPTGSGSSSVARDRLAEPAVDLEDAQGPDLVRHCYGPIPPEQLAVTDSDPDFPDAGRGACEDEGVPDGGVDGGLATTTLVPRRSMPALQTLAPGSAARLLMGAPRAKTARLPAVGAPMRPAASVWRRSPRGCCCSRFARGARRRWRRRGADSLSAGRPSATARWPACLRRC